MPDRAKVGYMVLDAAGDALDAQDNLDDAKAAAKKLAAKRGGQVWADPDQLKDEPERNPLTPPEAAYRNTGLEALCRPYGQRVGTDGKGQPLYGLTRDLVMAIDVPTAHKRLRSYLPQGAGWDTPWSAASKILGNNSKMAKGATSVLGVQAASIGLMLLPHFIPFRGGLAQGPTGSRLSLFAKLPAEILEHYRPTGKGERHTFCNGSNLECRTTCLVYSGQNQITDAPVLAKHALTAALLHDPQAFARLLVENLRRMALDAEQFVRLNVFSDIPWEVMFPDLFALAGADGDGTARGGWIGPGLKCYDYTKNPGRHPPDNYYLTFSFSGSNATACRAELAAGRNAAVVFVLQSASGDWLTVKGEKVKAERRPLRQRHADAVWLGFDLWGYPVLNGDLHDVRPFDRQVHPGPCIVGLDYKPSRVKVRAGKGKTEALSAVDAGGTFVLKVTEIDGAPPMAGLAGQRIAYRVDAEDA